MDGGTGDDEAQAPLERALAGAGVRMPADDVRALIRGVAAAAVRDKDWLRLLLSTTEGALADRLETLRRAYAAAPDGIDAPQAAARLKALRAELARRRLDGFVVPRSDEHQGEYVAGGAQRLAWLTGFTGSAGLAIVLAERAALFVDGRYTLQAASEVDGALYEHRHLTRAPADEWLRRHLPAGAALGYDPRLHGERERDSLAAPCRDAGARLAACADNPVDAIWDDRPPPPLGPVAPHPLRFAGTDAAEKRRRVADAVAAARADAALLSAPDSIAWLLNVRGADVPNSPLPHSFAIVNADRAVDWFVDRRKLLPEVAAHLGAAVRVRPPVDLAGALDALARKGKAVLVDPAATPVWMVDRLAGKRADAAVRGPDPCAALKARKNDVEHDGIRAAHRRDGAALVRFLAWLEAAAAGGAVTERSAAARLAALREGGTHYRGPSFDTISGAGPNGAIVHYRVTPESDRRLEPGTLYLVDSGAQYLDGTTDVTRTVALGAPLPEHRDRFTRVLRGHIALATATFPRGTTGAQLDALARQFLWQAGLDYDHGTGHGVGCHLNVHEGPQRIARAGDAPLEPGMVVSNEPGYYKTGAYGIRIENLVAVTAAAAPEGAERELLGFETLTLAPIDRALIEAGMLTEGERAWLDRYHRRVARTLAPLLAGDSGTLAWLAAATEPLADA